VRRARIDGKPRAQARRAQLVRMAQPEGHGEEERRPHQGVPGAPTAIVECIFLNNISLCVWDISLSPSPSLCVCRWVGVASSQPFF
jgi:hypothetical protein